MKKLFSGNRLGSVFALMLLFVIGLSTCTIAQTTDNYIKITGKMIIDDYLQATDVDVLVFTPAEESPTGWIQEEEFIRDYKYKVKLDPTQEYEIWFFTNTTTKILHISPAVAGAYSYKIDIDFRKGDAADLKFISHTPGNNDGYHYLTYVDNSDKMQNYARSGTNKP